jgi:hypothetical protein
MNGETSKPVSTNFDANLNLVSPFEGGKGNHKENLNIIQAYWRRRRKKRIKNDSKNS